MSNFKYIDLMSQIIKNIDETQADNIKAAADICANVIASGKMVHIFGSGHSVLPIQDVFPRYGGIVGWHPLMDPRLMWFNVLRGGGVREVIWLERQEGYIVNFLRSFNFQKDEAMVVFSHGGLNAAPVEAAMYAKDRGLKVIVVIGGENYRNAKATHSSGKKLGDMADIIIDNCCPIEDALVKVPDQPQPVGASSTMAAIVVAQTLASETSLLLQKKGYKMFTFVSPNVKECPPGYVDEIYADYLRLIRACGN